MIDESRRRLLKAAVGLSGMAAAGVGCLPDVSAARQVRLTLGPGGSFELDLSLAAELASPGGAVIVADRRREIPTVLVINDGGDYLALSGSCTHAGCPVGVKGNGVVCPCHLSEFDFSGKVTHPPATRALRTFPISLTTPDHLSISLTAGDGTFPAPQNGVLVLPFADFPVLKTPGNFLFGTPAGIITPIFVLSLPGGSFSTLSAICTHSQCTLDFESDRDDLYCNCHGSRFTSSGRVVDGPANDPLPTYATTADDVAVTIQLA